MEGSQKGRQREKMRTFLEMLTKVLQGSNARKVMRTKMIRAGHWSICCLVSSEVPHSRQSGDSCCWIRRKNFRERQWSSKNCARKDRSGRRNFLKTQRVVRQPKGPHGSDFLPALFSRVRIFSEGRHCLGVAPAANFRLPLGALRACKSFRDSSGIEAST